MMEIIFHVLGFCGEHWHPNLFIIILFVIVLKLFRINFSH